MHEINENKLNILKEICKFYNFELEISDKIYYYCGTKYDENDSYCAYSVDEALKQWLETLEETDKCNICEGVEPIWTDVISYIYSL